MLPLLIAAALAFPQSISSPRPVSPVTLTAPLYDQTGPVFATNGTTSLVAWTDRRRGASNPFALGTRIGADGTPLDPLGIVIKGITSPEAAFWTGANFVVIGQTKTGRAAVSVGLDGSLSAPKVVDVPLDDDLAAVSSSGPDARVLFLRHDANTALTGRIINAQGDVVVDVAALLASPLGTSWIAAGRQNDFAILGPSATVRLDRNGRVLANTAVLWPFPSFAPQSISVAGNDGQGFVLVRQDQSLPGPGTVLASQLSDDAAFTGKSAIIDVPSIFRLAQTKPAIAATGNDYVVVNLGVFGDNSLHEFVSRLSFDLTASVAQVPVAGVPATLRIENGQRFLVAALGHALYLQRFSDTFDGSVPTLLNVSATTQAEVAVAASATGYAVAWYESASDSSTHLYVRRFSVAGDPLDPSPLEANRVQTPIPAVPPVLTAAADVYFVNGRRLSAVTGAWIDTNTTDPIASGSNGHDALFVVRTGTGEAVQRIPSSGNASSNPVLLPISANGNYAAIASNGSDYLVVWSLSNICTTLCVPQPTPVYALRVRSDGAWSDAGLLQISPDGAHPSVAWVNGAYVVTWTSPDGIRATRITADGRVLDGIGIGVLVEAASAQNESVTSAVVPFNGDVLLFVHHVPTTAPAYWDATRVAPNDLGSALTAKRTVLPPTDGSLAAASLFERLIVAYDSNADPATGYVPRVYVEPLADPTPRRRTVAH